MWAILRTCGQVCATPTAAVIPSADWMLVMRKQYFGLGTALSKRKSVQPSVKIVSTWSSSATGPSAGVLALEMMPVNRSILPSSFIRRNSLTLASVPAASSAVMVSIWRLPRNPPWALISSAAIVWPFSDGSPSTAAALVRKVMWPTLNGVSGILPLAGSWSALRTRDPPIRPALATPAPPAATPNVFRKLRRLVVDVLSMKFLPRKADCLIVDPREQPRYYYIILAECEQPSHRAVVNHKLRLRASVQAGLTVMPPGCPLRADGWRSCAAGYGR